MVKQSSIHFTVPGRWTPERKRSYRRGKHTVRVDTAEAADFKAVVRYGAQEVCSRPLEGPLTALYVFYRPKPSSYRKGDHRPYKRPDADNLAKVLNDGLEGVAFLDDAQICDLRVMKEWGDRWEVEVWIEPDEEWPYCKEPDDE